MTSAALRIGINEKSRHAVAAVLTRTLAEELLLSATIRHCLGSVPVFHSLHRLCCDQSRELGRWLNELGSRIWAPVLRAGAAVAPRATRVVFPTRGGLGRGMVEQVRARHEELGVRLRADAEKCSRELGDLGAAQFLGRFAEFHEISSWVLGMALEAAEPARV